MQITCLTRVTILSYLLHVHKAKWFVFTLLSAWCLADSIAVNTRSGLKLQTVGSNFLCLRTKDNGCTVLDLGVSLGNTEHNKWCGGDVFLKASNNNNNMTFSPSSAVVFHLSASLRSWCSPFALSGSLCCVIFGVICVARVWYSVRRAYATCIQILLLF